MDIMSINIDGSSSRSFKLFRRGNAISGAPNIKGNYQLPNPPIRIGIMKKKISKNASAVIIVLHSCSLPINDPGILSSIQIIILIMVTIHPAHVPNRKYVVPISL